MSRSSRAKISDSPKHGLTWGDRVEWTYKHFLNGHAYTLITKRGKFTGLSHHSRRAMQMYGFKQKAFVHFDGNKNNSRVPVSELKKI